VKRAVLLFLGMAMIPLLGIGPSAQATAVGACTIGGTLTFSPTGGAAAGQGQWRIDPGVIDCHGLFRGWERITGPGTFTGSGSFTTLPTGNGACLQQIGTGDVEYTIPTTEVDAHIKEAHEFVVAGAGVFSTPSLRGTFQISPPYEGDCLTKPLTKASFVAQATMVRMTQGG
jgi:hypothetical protein